MKVTDEKHDQAKRLKLAREARFKTATDGWNHVRRFTDIKLDSYIQHENGHRGFKSRASVYAEAFGVNLDWLWNDKGPQTSGDISTGIPIVGYAAAGPDGHFLNAYPDGGHPTVDPFPEGSIAVMVEGDSMEPRFYPREVLIFGPEYRDPTPFIGREVLAYLGSEDGRTLIKILDRNKATGNWNLKSYNPRHDMIEDVHLEWVRCFKGMHA